MTEQEIVGQVKEIEEDKLIEEMNQISLLALINKKPIIHTLEEELIQAVEMHTHGMAAIGALDMKAIFPLGYQSTNLDPSIFEIIINEKTPEPRQLTLNQKRENLFAKKISANVDDFCYYSVFIIKEDCDVEEHNGQMLPYRFVKVFWSYEKDADYEKQIAPYKDSKFYLADDPEVLAFQKINQEALIIYVNNIIKAARDEVDEKYMDSIGLDFDLPNLEKIDDDDALATLASDFWPVYDQLPNNPLFLHRPPRDMPKDKMHVYGISYNENIDLYNTKCSITIDDNELDKETLTFVREKMKCRVAIYSPDDIDDDILKDWDFEEIKTHRSILFVPVDKFDLETMSHLNDDVNRRLEELQEFFKSFED